MYDGGNNENGNRATVHDEIFLVLNGSLTISKSCDATYFDAIMNSQQTCLLLLKGIS